MRTLAVSILAAASLSAGIGIGYAAKVKGPGMALMTGKSAKEAGLAALQYAESMPKLGSWELIGIARVYYLSGDKAKGQALLDQVLTHKPESSDYHRIARLYAEAGEQAKAEELFLKTLDADDDSGQLEIGAWLIRSGQREKGEALLAKAFANNPDEFWHYVHSAEAYLGLAPN